MRRTVLAGMALLGCTRGSTPSPEPPIRADDAAVPAATSIASNPPPLAPTPSAHATGAVFCTSDADCGWDDPCMAKRCVGAAPFGGCDKSRPPPGTCTCIDSTCTMKRSAAAPKEGSCKADAECGFDAAGGVCKPGAPKVSRIVEQGALCTCDGGSCALEWVGPVECKSSADCSWLEGPRRPAPASKVPRPHPPVKPCAGGSWDSVCTSGSCRIVAWKC